MKTFLKNYYILFLLFSVIIVYEFVHVTIYARIPSCSNSKHVLSNEFKSAYQLILKKRNESKQLLALLPNFPQYTDCINIERADLDEQDSGFAVFYPGSTLQKLHIFFDFLYRSKDVPLTGYLLVGKLARANDFIISREGMFFSCTQQNIHEGQAQLAYLVQLTAAEKEILQGYIKNEFYTYKDFITKKMLSQELEVVQQCTKAKKCESVIIEYPKNNNIVLDSDNQCF